MPLNDLSLRELIELSDQLQALRVAGEALVSRDIEARFDLTPGVPASIMTDIVLPNVGPSAFQRMAEALYPLQSTEAAQPDPAPVPVDPPPAVEGPTGGAPHSTAPSRPDDAELPQVSASDGGAGDSGGGLSNGSGSQPPAAAVPGPALAPGSASALAASARNAAGWTEEEDTRLVAGIVARVIGQGESRRTAIRAMAEDLGRPFEGTYFRTNNKLKTRLDDALVAAQEAKAEAEALLAKSPEAAHQDDSPAAEPMAEASEPEPGAAVHIAPDLTPAPVFASSQPPGAPPPDLQGQALDLWRHLQAHRPRWPMTVDTDLELVERLGLGEKLPMIAADIGLDPLALKNRWHILTNQILDPRGNPTIDGTARLIEVLRRIVDDAKPAPAERGAA